MATFRGYDSWMEKREDVERALYEGWRQHWLDMWSRIGTQYYIDCTFKQVSKNMVLMSENMKIMLDRVLEMEEEVKQMKDDVDTLMYEVGLKK